MSVRLDINAFQPYREGRYPLFTSSENRCTHVGKNVHGNMVRQFKIDGEVFPKDTSPERCDYLLLNDEAKTSYYIELKGSDLEKAIEQIEGTIAMIAPSIPTYSVYRRIVYKTATHKIHESKVLLWQKRYIKSAAIKERRLEESI